MQKWAEGILSGGDIVRIPSKINKAGNPGHPIVPGHPTEKISEFVDLHLQPHVQNLPSYLDTTYFLRKQDDQAPFPPDTLLVFMDVTSLYTDIPHQDDIQACEEVWKERKVKDPLHGLWWNFWHSYSKATTLSQRETLSPGPRHCYGYQNSSCIRQYFHGSSRGTAVKVSDPETIFVVKVHWRYWHKVVARPWDIDNFPRRGQQLPPKHKVHRWNFKRAARVSEHWIKACGRYVK